MTAQPGSLQPRPTLSQQLGKYQLVTTLGQGGMGTVYLALASGLGQFRKLLVVKELRQDLTRQVGFVGMFMDEAKLAARLAHPNVVQTFEASEVGDRYFLAMEYLDGQSLSALLDRLEQSPNTKWSLWMHLQILCETLLGLHYAHELLDYDGSSLNVVHRDVSPQNVFVTYHGQVKVVDFGVAKVGNACVKTAPGLFIGKFSYAAPEQVQGGAVDARTDVFAAGVMLWRAIAGRPFSDQTPTPEACRARCEGLEPRISEVVPTVDPLLAEICDRALAVNPEKRFASAQAFRAALMDYVQRLGMRVEAAEIGQLMHEIFDAERRTMHGQIERVMRRTGMSNSSVEELSMFHYIDKEPTAVADLSSLIEVSLEQDEQKIRQNYAHSHTKVTLVRPPSTQEPSIPMPTIDIPSRHRLLIVSASIALALVGAVVVASIDSSPSKTKVVPHAPITVLSAAIASPPAPSPSPAVTPAPRETPPSVIAFAQSSALSTRKQTASAANRGRYHASSSPLSSLSHSALSPAHDTSIAEPASNPRAVEEGSDLFFSRRTNVVAIDRENPYR